MKKMNERKKAVRFFCIAMAVLLFSSIMIWGFQTDWGYVKIERLMLNAPDGSKLSTLIYIPDTATPETPAPAAVICHGRSNQAHSNDTWCMELARRGYVVLSPDLSGGGESDVVDRDMQSLTTAKYALTLDIIDKDQFNLLGYSKGCTSAITAAYALADQVNTVMLVLGPFMVRNNFDMISSLLREHDVDVATIKADADQYDYMLIGDGPECRKFVKEKLNLPVDIVPEQDIQLGETSIFRYYEVTGTMHQTGNISADSISAILDFENDFNNAPIQRENTDQAWLPQQIFSGIACVTMMFALAAAINLLMQLDFFKSTMSFKRAPRKEQRGLKAWVLDILFAVAIPALLFIKVSTWGINWFANSKILTSTNLNGIMLWLLVAMCLIGLIRLAIRTYRRKAAGEVIAASDFCLAPQGGKFYWPNVGKAFIIGIVCTAFFGLWMAAMEGYMGINYQVWNVSTYLKPSPERIVKAIPYIIIIMIVMFSGNISQRVLPSTGNERRDMWIAVTVNSVLTAFALFLLLVIQYGGSLIVATGWVPFEGVNGSTGALDFAFGYCYMMGGTTGVVTYLYRKHGNVLCGVIPASIFCGLFTLLSFTLVR